MRPSRFNVFVPEDRAESDILIYNALTGAIVRVSKLLARALKARNTSTLATAELTDVVNDLSSVGVVVDDDRDELKEFGETHARWKEGRESVEFTALMTYNCNFECPYCYQGRGEVGQKIHGFKPMSAEMLERVKSFIKKMTLEKHAKDLELVIYGGEPFLMPDACRDLADSTSDWAKSEGIGFRLHALSNGSLITPEIVDWLSSYSCRLQIPVDGAPETHNQYRFYKQDRRGSFDDVTRVLGMTKGTNIETHIRISLTTETRPTMEQLLDELKGRGLTHVYPDFCYITAFTDACLPFENRTLKDQDLFRIMPELWMKAHARGFPLDIRPHPQPLPCSSIADGSFIVDPFGNAYKCWELVGLPQHVVGRINPDGSLAKTPVYGDVLARNPLNIASCRVDPILPSCAGGCVCKAQWQSGTYHAAGCGTERHLLKDKVRVYVKTQKPSVHPMRGSGDLHVQVIEGRQKPNMSHCYVLV